MRPNGFTLSVGRRFGLQLSLDVHPLSLGPLFGPFPALPGGTEFLPRLGSLRGSLPLGGGGGSYMLALCEGGLLDWGGSALSLSVGSLPPSLAPLSTALLSLRHLTSSSCSRKGLEA